MQNAHFWYKLNLPGKKVGFVLLVIILAFQVQGQQKYKWVEKNNPNYDNKKLTYGFLIALHTSIYQLDYADQFVTTDFDTVHSVTPSWKQGFSLGFIVNYKLTEYLDLRLTPSVAFYENEVSYFYTDDTPTQTYTVETTMVEFPLLLKYKSERRGNIRMYTIGGIKPAIEASGKKRQEGIESNIEVKPSNISLEVGFGLDLYYPLFKFSPELRFSRGLMDVLDNKVSPLGQPISRLNTNTITLYLLFQ